jgi:hypothetical protein
VQKMKKSLKLISVLFVLAVFWVFYFVLQFTYRSPENANKRFIPTNANFVMVIDGNLTLKSVLSDFISSRDEKLLGEMNDSRDDLKQTSGIDVLSDFIFFTVDNRGTQISGVLFNLTRERDFKAYFSDRVIASNSSVGLLLFNESESANTYKLKQFANSVLKEKNQLFSKKLAKLRENESIISIWTRVKSHKKWNYANLEINGSKIKVNGTAVLANKFNCSLKKLSPNNSSIHLSSNSFIPKAFSDSISNFLGIKSNQIVGASVNYRSMKIEQETSFKLVPDADFIFEFADKVDLPMLLSIIQQEEMISELTENSFMYGEKRFHFDQLSNNSVYIGRTPTRNIVSKKCTSILSIHGAPMHLSKIEGSSFMLRLINIFPAYRMGKGLSNTIKSIDLDIEAASSNVVKIKGEIKFGKGKYASIELIRSLLELR